jgi:predicted DNA-binding ribbon-helix-helix protein
MKSSVIKRSVVTAGHKTSVNLEDAFWNCLREIAKERGQTLSALIGSIDTDRQLGNLSSAIRLFVLGCFYRDQPDPNGRNATEVGCVELCASKAANQSLQAWPSVD